MKTHTLELTAPQILFLIKRLAYYEEEIDESIKAVEKIGKTGVAQRIRRNKRHCLEILHILTGDVEKAKARALTSLGLLKMRHPTKAGKLKVLKKELWILSKNKENEWSVTDRKPADEEYDN